MPEKDTVVTAPTAPQDVAAEAAEPLAGVESPPPAPRPPRDLDAVDPRARVLQLAAELARYRNRRLLAEFLRLRRAV